MWLGGHPCKGQESAIYTLNGQEGQEERAKLKQHREGDTTDAQRHREEEQESSCVKTKTIQKEQQPQNQQLAKLWWGTSHKGSLVSVGLEKGNRMLRMGEHIGI